MYRNSDIKNVTNNVTISEETMKQEAIDRIRKFTEDRDWDQFHTPANLAKYDRL